MRNVLYYFTQKHNGNWEGIYNSLSVKEIIPKEKYSKLSMNDFSNYTCLIDQEYPNELKTIYKPPFSMFMYGNKKLLNEKLLGIYGDKINSKICNELTKLSKIIFVLDFENKNLINYFLDNSINFICVYKNGFVKMDKKLFDRIINKNNLVITEMPNENKTTYNDQLHNRIIFGLSKKMLFLEKNDNFLFKTILEFCELENVLCFSFKDTKNKYIKKIKSLKEIFINHFIN